MAKQNELPRMKPFRPIPKAKFRLIGLIFVFFLIIGSVIFFQSSLSKIQAITVEGNLISDEEVVKQKSELFFEDSFFAFRSGAVENRIKQIPGVKSAHVKRDFPGKIILQIDEYRLAGYQVVNGKAEMVLEDGTILGMTDLSTWLDRPILTNWSGNEKLKLKLCKVLAGISYEEVADLSEIMPMPSKAYPDKIKIYTRSSFEVITTVSKLKGKLPYLANVVTELISKGQTSGRITMLEANTSQPFVKDSQE